MEGPLATKYYLSVQASYVCRENDARLHEVSTLALLKAHVIEPKCVIADWCVDRIVCIILNLKLLSCYT